jgi:predicted ribosomally synthesized peptide with nif11-like leader
MSDTDGHLLMGDTWAITPLGAMSEEQLSALLARLKEDAGLREKLQGAADFDAAEATAKEAGLDVSKEDWVSFQANQILELSDETLEAVTGGRGIDANTPYGYQMIWDEFVKTDIYKANPGAFNRAKELGYWQEGKIY